MNLPDEISRFAENITSSALARICELLDFASPGVTSSDVLVELEEKLADWAIASLRVIARNEARPDVLAFGLRCAAAATDATSKQLGETNLVWSGPDGGVASVRSLEQALRDLILGAESELWLVSFAAYRVPHLHDTLRLAANKNVSLHFLLETTIDSAGALSVNAHASFPADLLAVSRLYVWPLEKRPCNAAGNPAKLHSKFAVADRRTALISSANLTADALERNMEAGVLVRDGAIPRLLAAHVDNLVNRKFIRELNRTC